MIALLTVFVGALLANVVGKAAIEFFLAWKYRLKPSQFSGIMPEPMAVGEIEKMRQAHQSGLELKLAALDYEGAPTAEDLALMTPDYIEARKTERLREAAKKFASLSTPLERPRIELDLAQLKHYGTGRFPLGVTGCEPGSHPPE